MQIIKLIGIDLDGTALDSQKRISEKNREAFKKCEESGICVVPVTGRPFSGLYDEYIDAMHCSYSVNTNGAAAYSLPKGEKLISHMMTRERAAEIAEILNEYDCFYAVFIDGYGYLEEKYLDRELNDWRGTPLYKYLLRTRRVTQSVRGLIEASEGCDNIYVSAATTEIRENIRDAIGGVKDIYFTSSDARDVEIGGDCSKGTTLLELAGRLGIDKSEVMAIGDSGNDLDMLRKAGYSVAMGNASQKLLDEADYVTDTCENNGVAKAIEKLLNGELL